MSFILGQYSQQGPAWKSIKIRFRSDKYGPVGCALASAHDYIVAWYLQK